MSEYQCYQFKSFDRPLTPAERKEVSSWSSRVNASSTSATFTYSYGDFPKKEENVVLRYFDAMLYFANWGTRQLLLRFPKDLIDFNALKVFTSDSDRFHDLHISVKPKKEYVLIELYWNEEEGGGGWYEEDDFDVNDFQAIRKAIINGDYRGLYLFWLKVAATKPVIDEDEFDEDDDYVAPIPPIPSNLGKIDSSLQAIIDFFEIDEDLVAAAQNFSKTQKKTEINYENLLQQLPETERTNFLNKLLKDESLLATQFRKRLDKLLPKAKQTDVSAPSIQEILEGKIGATQVREKREAEEAAKAHKVKMEKVRKEAAIHWKTVYFNLERKSGKSYDIATEALRDLQDAAEFFGTLDDFTVKMREVRAKYGRSLTLTRRFEKAKLVK